MVWREQTGQTWEELSHSLAPGPGPSSKAVVCLLDVVTEALLRGPILRFFVVPRGRTGDRAQLRRKSQWEVEHRGRERREVGWPPG